MKIMSRNFLKSTKGNTTEVHLIFAVKPEAAPHLMADAHKFARSARRRYGSDYLIEEAPAAGQSESTSIDQVREINRNFENDDEPAISYEFSTVNVPKEPSQASHEEAVAALEYVARGIERGAYVLNPLLRQYLGGKYANDVAQAVPATMRDAIDTLTGPERTSPQSSGANQEKNSKKTIVNQRQLEFRTGYCSYQGEKPLVEVHGFWATKGKRSESK